MEPELEPDGQPEAETSAMSPCERAAAQGRACSDGEDPRLAGEAYTAMPGFRKRSLWKVVAAAVIAAALGVAGALHHGGSAPRSSSPPASGAGQLGH